MSIINDALKKTQKNLSGKKDQNILKPVIDQTDPNATAEQNAKITRKDTLKIIVIFSLMLILVLSGIILFLILKKPSASTPSTISYPAREIAPTPPEQNTAKKLQDPVKTVMETQPLQDPKKIPARITMAPDGYDQPLVLDGIMTIDNKNFALINGDDYEVGETIYGMKIISITGSSVEIQATDGKMIELNVKGK